MATLDPRLLPLIETLVASKADWLVFEMIEGIDAGIVTEESAEDLASARELARQEHEVVRPPEKIAVGGESRSLEGDEQIIWAARYVGFRLKEVLAMLGVSDERLNMLADRRVDSEVVQPRTRVLLGLRDEEEVITNTPSQLAEAQSAVSDLLGALQRWVGEVTGERSTL